MDYIIATHNMKKRDELQRILSPLGIRVLLAEEAGIERGDFIYSFDGEPVDSMEELQRKLMYYEGGTEVEILLYRYSNRGYKSITVTVTLGSKEDMQFQYCVPRLTLTVDTKKKDIFPIRKRKF